MKKVRAHAVFFVAAGIAVLALGGPSALGQTLDWEATQYFRYNIDDIMFNATTRQLTVTFSVSDPTVPGALWDIKNDAPFKSGARLVLDAGWDTADYTNIGARGNFNPVVGTGIAAALPISIDAIRNSTPVSAGSRSYVVTTTLPAHAYGTGTVVMEGRTVWPIEGSTSTARVPVKTQTRSFSIGSNFKLRREVVDIRKCKACHDNGVHSDQTIPRLSLHGANRNEETRACVVCHNPNQTDIAYRTSGAEESVDFKRLIHGIHGNKRRQNPLIVIGFGGSVNDFGDVLFPAEVKNCLTCHIETKNGSGTYQLPLAAGVLGSTIDTRSKPGLFVDVDPANDLKITPIAAVCSSCHDSSKAITHITSSRSGGRFGVLQSSIDNGVVRERCVDCHGAGRDKDVKKVHSVEKYELPGSD